MNTQNVNVKTATPESPKTCNENLTADQFLDLCRYVFANGKFGGPGGIPWRELSRYDEIAEPGDPEEGRTLYVTDGWPVAVYEFDIGYTVIRGALPAAE